MKKLVATLTLGMALVGAQALAGEPQKVSTRGTRAVKAKTVKSRAAKADSKKEKKLAPSLGTGGTSAKKGTGSK